MNNIYTTLYERFNVPTKLLRILGRVEMAAKKAGPELYLGTGIVAGIASGVLFAKAYKRHDDVMGDITDELEISRESLDPDDSPATRAKEMLPVYADYAKTFVRLYGPAAALGGASVYLILRSHGLMRGRNQALLASLGLFEAGFSKYRARVREELGEDADARFYYGTEEKTIVTVEENEETGKKKKTRTTENVIPEDPSTSMYSRIFDETNPEFNVAKELNRFYLSSNEIWANQLLQIRGWVMLNEVYEALHLPQTVEGQLVGWSLHAPGNNFIDFGIDNPINKHSGDNRFLLDFNVNGVVYELIGKGPEKDRGEK